MTRRTKLFAALLAAGLATAALAQPIRHPTAAGPCLSQMGMGGGLTGDKLRGYPGMMGHTGTMHRTNGMMMRMHAAPGGQLPGMMHGTAGMSGLEKVPDEEFEVAFMSLMIAHHQGAVDMADWVLERGDDPDVLSAARAIKAAQEPEVEHMTTWLREWHNTAVDPSHAAMMNVNMGDMMTATAGGADPDAAFLSEMIRHHQGAIDMAQLALERATHKELRDLARDIIVTQAGEVRQYQVWLDATAP